MAALNPFSTKSIFGLRIAPTHMQDLVLGLVEPHEVRTGPPLKPVKVTLMPSLPSSVSNAPYRLVWLANLLRVRSIPLSMSPTKMFSNAGPYTDPWQKPLVPGLHLDIEPLIATVWVQPSSQFLIQRVVRLSNPCLCSVETRMSQRAVSNALHKFRQMTSVALPLSTNTVTPL